MEFTLKTWKKLICQRYSSVGLPKRDELRPLEQIQQAMMCEKRKQEANALEKELYKDYKHNWKKVKSWLEKFIYNKFNEKRDYWIKKAFQDKEYSIRLSRQFHEFDTFEQSEHMETKKKILEQSEKRYYQWSGQHFYSSQFSFVNRQYEPCVVCGRNGKEVSVLRIQDVRQFIEFFELSTEEQKSLPKQMTAYLNQDRTLYDGNSILNDLDPITTIRNPWWVGEYNYGPKITISFALCKTHKNKYKN